MKCTGLWQIEAVDSNTHTVTVPYTREAFDKGLLHELTFVLPFMLDYSYLNSDWSIKKLLLRNLLKWNKRKFN